MQKLFVKSLVVIMIVCMFTAILAGCGGTGTKDTPAKTTAAGTLKGDLSCLIWLPDAPEIIQKQAEEFMKLYPDVKVDVQMMTGNGLVENLQPKLASNSLPDFFSNNSDELGGIMADDGKIADIGDTKAFANSYDSMQAAWTSPKKGVKYGISGGIATTLFYYNIDMFKKAGITEVPKDFDEFLAVCEKLKTAGFVPLVWYGGFPNMLSNGPFSYGLANNLANKDADFAKKILDGTLNLNTPEVADIYARIKLVADKDYVQKGYMSTDYTGGMTLFTDGNAAMIFQGNWASGTFMDNKKFETGVFLPPWNKKGEAIVPVIGSETGWSVAENKNKALSKAFLDYICGDGFAIYQNQRQNTPPFKQDVGKVVLNEKMKNFVVEINKSPVSSALAFQILPANTLDLTFKQMQEVLTNTKTPEQAAAELDKAVKDYAATKK